ncbi:MAG: hypothetical protein MUP15_07060 [Dehalococcoidia bacterium]|nr:hypothetical protein [Dehalococcoidia bacterium]
MRSTILAALAVVRRQLNVMVLVTIIAILGVGVAVFRTTPTSANPALVQKATAATGDWTEAGQISATFGSAPISGNLLIAIVGSRRNLTIDLPSGWQTAINESGGATVAPAQAIFYKIAAGSSDQTVEVFTGTTTQLGLQIYEYSGVDTLDQTASANGTGTSVSSGTTATTTLADELLIVGMVTLVQTNFSGWTDSFAEQNDFQGGAPVRTFAGADCIVTSTGTYSTTATAGVSGGWRGQIATFYEAATPTPTDTAAPTPTETATPTPTDTATPTPTDTATPTPTPTDTATPTPIGIATPTPTNAATPTHTATPTAAAASRDPRRHGATPTATAMAAPATAVPSTTPLTMPPSPQPPMAPLEGVAQQLTAPASGSGPPQANSFWSLASWLLIGGAAATSVGWLLRLRSAGRGN